jgi:hypothetical protein
MPSWVAPQWEWYYRLWHDVFDLAYPFTYYLAKWPWTLILGLTTVVGLFVVWYYARPNHYQWIAIVIAAVWFFLLGHLYFPTMN